MIEVGRLLGLLLRLCGAVAVLLAAFAAAWLPCRWPLCACVCVCVLCVESAACLERVCVRHFGIELVSIVDSIVFTPNPRTWGLFWEIQVRHLELTRFSRTELRCRRSSRWTRSRSRWPSRRRGFLLTRGVSSWNLRLSCPGQPPRVQGARSRHRLPARPHKLVGWLVGPLAGWWFGFQEVQRIVRSSELVLLDRPAFAGCPGGPAAGAQGEGFEYYVFAALEES